MIIGRTTTDHTTDHTAPTRCSVRRPAHRLIAAVGVGALVLAACGSSDDADSDAAESESVESAAPVDADADTGDASEGSDDSATATVDLAPVIECIEAADIVTAPTTFNDDFLTEQGIVAALGLGAMGNEFGGGSLYYFESAERAEEQAANFSAATEEAVVQDGVVVVQYASAVQDEAAEIVIGCAT